MKLSKAIKPISYVKAHAAEIIRDLNEGGGPMIITQNGEAKAVMLSVEEYERTQETLAMLKLAAMGEADIAAGRTRPAADVLAELRAGLRGK